MLRGEGNAAGTGGGHATAGGVEYQALLTASVAVAMLSGGTVSAWNLPSGTRIDSIRSETSEPIDDLNVALSTDGVVFIQAKRALSLDAQFRSATDQFVRQYLSKSSRPFDPQHDRLVLAAGRDSS